MGVRNGQQFIEGLQASPRDVWVNGEQVKDVTTHPAFSASVKQLAKLYDMQIAPETRDQMTYVVPETGERAGMAFMPAMNSNDLRRRRVAYQMWADQNFGLMGRSPDFLNCSLLAYWESRELAGKNGPEFPERIAKYYEYVRDNDLFLSHALLSPQNDRSKPSSEQAALHMRVIKEDSKGIYISGGRMIATLGPVSDEMIMYSLPGLQPGDENHALMFAIPTNSPGLRQICREPYTLAGQKSDFDHPLSNRFEENDSLLIFDNCFVPWDRVFIYRDVALSNEYYISSALRNHTAHQTNTRALVKMEFAVGVALEIARSIGADHFLHVQTKLGECLNEIEFLKSGLLRAEIECEPTKVGTVRPLLGPLQALRTHLPKAYPRVIEVIQTIAAGGFMMMPSGADFTVPELKADTEKYYGGANISSLDRARLFKLAWDLAGEAFGTRALQYERYYAGDPMRTLAMNYKGANDARPKKLVAAALALSGDPQPAQK